MLWRILVIGAALQIGPQGAAAQDQFSTALAVSAPHASGPLADADGKKVLALPARFTLATAQSQGTVNPYGPSALWQQGDWVTQACLLLLGLMSLASWYALLTRLLALRRLKNQTQDAANVFQDVRMFASYMATLTLDNPIRHVADAGSVAVHQYAALKPRVDYDTWLVRAIEQALNTLQTRLQSGLALLATVGSTAPFVGLFGTVWAIYAALVKVGATGQASIDRVAGPVGEALIMTALGLAVAVPAVFGYNWLLRQNKLAFESVRSFGAQLHSLLLATTDLTTPPAQAGEAEEPPEKQLESDFDSDVGGLDVHLSSPDAAPDIKL